VEQATGHESSLRQPRCAIVTASRGSVGALHGVQIGPIASRRTPTANRYSSTSPSSGHSASSSGDNEGFEVGEHPKREHDPLAAGKELPCPNSACYRLTDWTVLNGPVYARATYGGSGTPPAWWDSHNSARYSQDSLLELRHMPEPVSWFQIGAEHERPRG
jgi:hypothetical protein